MSENNPEKYISIKYNKWVNYYKPLENTNIRLEKELKEEKESKKIIIGLKANERFESLMGFSFVYAFIDFNIENVGKIHTLSEETLRSKLQYLIDEQLQRTCEERYNKRIIFATKENLQNYLFQYNTTKIEIEQKKTEIWEKISKIPKIVRWLFKIN